MDYVLLDLVKKLACQMLVDMQQIRRGNPCSGIDQRSFHHVCGTWKADWLCSWRMMNESEKNSLFRLKSYSIIYLESRQSIQLWPSHQLDKGSFDCSNCIVQNSENKCYTNRRRSFHSAIIKYRVITWKRLIKRDDFTSRLLYSLFLRT